MKRATPFFDLLPDMFCSVGTSGCFEECNDSFAAGLGSDAASLIGRPVRELLHPDDLVISGWAAPVAEIVRSGRAVHEARYLHADGVYRWMAWSFGPDVTNAVIYCSVRDITETREQAAVVTRLLAELERSNTDLAQFAYVASHDLSEPLRMVSSYVQLLASRYKGQLDADADEFIVYAVDGAARMKTLIDDLLEYSRSGTLVIRRQVDTSALLRSTLADLAVVIAETGATVSFDDLPVIPGDPGQLSQLFHNLLSNALKFVTPGTAAQIRVSAVREEGAWCFSVEDNGIGIPDAHRARIFLMFKRLHGRHEYPGTGIGLALCHKIVSRFGGRIWLESNNGHGSVFRFTVPDESPTIVESGAR